DPLRFDLASLVSPGATACILAVLEEAMCVWPRRRPAQEILRRIREPHIRPDRACEAMQRSLYQLIFDLVRLYAMRRTGCSGPSFARMADAIGLIDQDRKPDTFDRYAECHVRTFVQIRMLNEARVFLKKLFAAKRIDIHDLG